MMSGNDLENSARKKSACTKLISLFSKHPQCFSSLKVNLHYIYHGCITILSFDNVNKGELFKTIKEIEKILLNSISYISHNIFNPFLTHYSIDIYFDTSTTGSF